jgi:urease accessory protein
VEEGAAAEWLPQETILFDRCALNRVLTVDLAEESWFLGVESLVFGRAAMGELVQRGEISDTIRVRRGGRLVLHDAIRLSGAVDATLARPAVARGANAVATILHIAPNAPARLEEIRESLANTPAECGASAWDGMLVARILAESSAALRTAVIAGLEILRDGRPLPRVWCC